MPKLAVVARLVTISTLACLCFSAQAQVYKWKDANGVTHYGEKPPEGGKSKEVHLSNSAPAGGPEAPNAGSQSSQNLQEREREFRRRQVARETAEAKRQADQKNLDAKCQYASGRLAEMRKAGRVYNYNANGQREYMDDKQRDALVAQREQEYAQYCK